MKVLLSSPRYSRMYSMLKDMLPDDIHVIISKEGTDEELIQLAIDVDVIVCTKLSEEVAQAARKLKLVQKSGAGVDGVSGEKCAGLDILWGFLLSHPLPGFG